MEAERARGEGSICVEGMTGWLLLCIRIRDNNSKATYIIHHSQKIEHKLGKINLPPSYKTGLRT